MLDAHMQQYQQDYARLAPTMPGFNLTWVAERRDAAFMAFEAQGFPTKKDEDWKYTSTHTLAQLPFQARAAKSKALLTDGAEFILPDTMTVFIRDGQFAIKDNTRLPTEVLLMSLDDALAQDLPGLKALLGSCVDFHHHGFTALNTAMMNEGMVLIVPANCYLTMPIHLIYTNTQNNQVLHPRHLILLQENAQATVIETYLSQSGSVTFTNTVSEIVLEKNAKLTHYKQIQESDSAYHVGTVHARLNNSAEFISHSFAVSGQFVRSDTEVDFTEPNATTSLNGFYAAAKAEHIDHHTTILHQVESCSSREHYRGIITDTAHAVFNGKVIVSKNAKKTDAQQINKNLLLSKQAMIDTKPQLEIFNDDVRCTHGATVGQFDADALFYLQSRGIDLALAKKLLLQAFAEDLVGAITFKPLQEQVRQILSDKLFTGFTGG